MKTMKYYIQEQEAAKKLAKIVPKVMLTIMGSFIVICMLAILI